jgi:small subunit ribosomal protein S6
MNNRKYEAMYIVRPDMADGDIEKLADRFKTVVEEKGGKVENAGKWEKRKLAYELAGLKEGNYIQMNFESGPAVPQELNRLLGIHDDVIRHRIFKMDE